MKWRRSSGSPSSESSPTSESSPASERIPDYGTPPPKPPPISWAPLCCVVDKQIRLASFRQVGTEWQLSWVDDSSVPDGDSRRDSAPMSGSFVTAADYPGCPGCSNAGFVRCGSCTGLGCWQPGTKRYHCPHCKVTAQITGSITSIKSINLG
ncbi:MAG TPA: hypothetical protein VLL08_29135 [Kineosporiaceae bacterium]|nr:hypothetical protein [Kineosporiaceae bacterium]